MTPAGRADPAGGEPAPTTAHAVPATVRAVPATTLLAFAFWVAMLGTTLPTPLYPGYQQRYGFSALTVTIIFAVYAVGVVASLLAFGGLSDQVGRRPLLLAGLALSGVSALLFLLAGGLGPFLVARALSGLSAGLFTGTATAALIDVAPEGRGARANAIAIAANIGGLGSGTLLAGLLARYAPHPLRLTFVVNVVLVASAVLAVLAWRERHARVGAVRLRIQRLRVPREVRGVFVAGSLSSGAGFAVSGVLTALTGIFLGRALGMHNPAVTGAVVAANFAGTVVSQLTARRFALRTALTTGCIGLVVASGLLAAALVVNRLAPLVAAAVLTGLSTGLCFGGGLGAVNRDAPARVRGETASSFFAVVYVMLAVPAVGVGIAVDAVNLRDAGVAFSVVVAAIALAVLPFALRMRPGTSRQPEPPSVPRPVDG